MQYREAVAKVIHYMTLGIDVSRLFSDMMIASASLDLVQKKLVCVPRPSFSRGAARVPGLSPFGGVLLIFLFSAETFFFLLFVQLPLLMQLCRVAPGADSHGG